MIKYSNVELIPLSRDHSMQITVWANNLPKTRMRPFWPKFPIDVEDIQELAENHSENQMLFVVQKGKQAAGLAILGPIDWKNRKTELFTFIDSKIDDYDDVEVKAIKSLLLYSFKELGLNKIYYQVLLNDVYLVDLLEQAGFKPEVRKRSHYFSEGKYHHVLEASILASEFDYERNLLSSVGKK